MALNKNTLPTELSPRIVPAAALPSGAKTISQAFVYKDGCISVLEIQYTDSTSLFVKAVHTDSSFEIGGTADLTSGTKVGF